MGCRTPRKVPKVTRHRRNRRTFSSAGHEQPSQIGPYRIAAELGRGGMGVVYRGEHVDTGEPTAIKTVSTAGPHELSSLRREIHALIQIQHPGVVRFIEQGMDQGRPWYAMELLARRTLEDLRDELFPELRQAEGGGTDTAARSGTGDLGEDETLQLDDDAGAPRTETFPTAPPQGGALAASGAAEPARPPNGPTRAPAPAMPIPSYQPGNLNKVLALAYELCRTLSLIHGHGIVHRDFKPSNVFLRGDGTPVLTDFGLVSRIEGEQGREVLQITGGVRGTPGYMAPEQILGMSVDARADLYALGCTLYELLTGTPPFVRESPVGLLWAHLHDPIQPPSERVEGLPPALDPLLLQLLAKQRRNRFGHAEDVAAALVRLGATASGPGSQPARQPTPAPGSERAPVPRTYLYRPEMVGRDGLMDALEVRLQQLHSSRGGMILVGGESGAGKTCLATALTAAAIRRDVRVVIGECLPVTPADETAPEAEAAPLHPFRQLLHTVADCCVEGGAEVTERLLGAWAKVLAAHEPMLATLPGMSDHPEPAKLPLEAAHARLMAALEQVLERFVADAPLLLVLDDLQWADALSLQFLSERVEKDLSGRALLILGTYRTEETNAALQALVDTPWIEKIMLERLEADAIATMVGDMLGLRWSPSGLVRFLAEQSRGNPFFVTEYMRAAVAEGLLFREGGRWRMGDGGKMGSLASYEALPLPHSLEALMSRRLARLSEAAWEMAALMAVLGREVETELLLQAAGALRAGSEPGNAAGLEALGELLAREVLEEARGSRVRFVHDKLRATAYSQVAPARLPALHRAAGEALEMRRGSDDGFALRYPEMVRHWRAAGDIARTLTYLDRAGQHAAQTGAHADAVRYLREALDLHTSLGGSDGLRRARWERLLGEAYLALHQSARSRQHLERAVALCGMPLPRMRQRLILALGREALVQAAHRVGVGPARATAPGELEALSEAARSYALLHGAYRSLGNPERVFYAVLRSLNLAERGTSAAARAVSYSGAQAMAATVSLHRLAARYERLAHHSLGQVDAPHAHSLVHLMSAITHLGQGRWQQALGAAEASERIAEMHGFRQRVDEASICIAAVHVAAGRLDRASLMYRRIHDSSARGSTVRHRAWTLVHLSQIAVMRGQPDQAASVLAEIDALPGEQLEVVDEILVHAATARVRLHQGEYAAAQAAAARAWAHMADMPTTTIELLTACTALLEVSMCLWRRCIEASSEDTPAAQARAHGAEQILAFARSMARAFPVLGPDTRYWQGARAALSGRQARALRCWKRSLAAATALDLPYQQARAHLALARTLPPGPAARLHAAGATALLTRLGIPEDATGEPRANEEIR